MRDANKPASMRELMGGDDAKISLSNLHEFLGDKMPEIPFNRVGRLRLVHALQNRFGVNYRQIPGVNDVLTEFDKHVGTQNVIKQNKGVI